MKFLGEIMAPIGKYTDQNGDEKTRWGRCGSLLRNENGNYRIKLDMLPVGNENDGWFAVFEPKQKEETPAANPTQTKVDPQEDMPF